MNRVYLIRREDFNRHERGKSTRSNSLCKGPEVGPSTAILRKSSKAHMSEPRGLRGLNGDDVRSRARIQSAWVLVGQATNFDFFFESNRVPLDSAQWRSANFGFWKDYVADRWKQRNPRLRLCSDPVDRHDPWDQSSSSWVVLLGEDTDVNTFKK